MRPNITAGIHFLGSSSSPRGRRKFLPELASTPFLLWSYVRHGGPGGLHLYNDFSTNWPSGITLSSSVVSDSASFRKAKSYLAPRRCNSRASGLLRKSGCAEYSTAQSITLMENFTQGLDNTRTISMV